MKFSILREDLLPALQTVNGVVERRQTLPILSNLLLNAQQDSILLTASDMEVELTMETNNAVDSIGEVTLPARKLLDICRALPDEANLNLNIAGDRVLLTSGKSRFILSTLPAQEYPLVEINENIADFKISQSKLKTLLDRTAFAMAQQDVRYYLNGLLFELEGDRLRAVATDGHRLALCDTEVKSDQQTLIQIIIPRKGVMELLRLLHEGDDDILVQISKNHIRIKLGLIQFTSKLIDGKFPDYVKVIPAEAENYVIADKELLRQSLTRASILSNEKYKGVRIILEKDKLRALTHNPEQEEAEEEIEVSYSGEELEIGFNVSYLLDALSHIKTEKVQITMIDPSSSCLILPDGPSKTKYVVMPMRL